MTPHDKLLVNREKWTLQETFDFIVTNLIKQKYPSVSVDGLCSYRDKENNRKCALGWFLRDSEYNKGFEGHGAYSIYDDLGIDISTPMKDMLAQLQSVHDNEAGNHEVKFAVEDFAYVAECHGLTLPKVEN